MIYLIIFSFFSGCNDDKDSYDTFGFNLEGIHKDTKTKFDRIGYDKDGYNKDGFRLSGIHKDTKTKFNPMGYDEYGYNKNGFNLAGIHKDTKTKFNPVGYDKDDYDKEGYNKNGFNLAGIHKDTKTKFNFMGYNKDGYNKDGLKKDCFNFNEKNICLDETNANKKALIKNYEKIDYINKEINNFKILQNYDIKNEYETTSDYEIRKNKILESEYIKSRDTLKNQLLENNYKHKYISLEIENQFEFKNICSLDINEHINYLMYDFNYNADTQLYSVKTYGYKIFNYNLTTDTEPNNHRAPILYFKGDIISTNFDSVFDFNFRVPIEKAKSLKKNLKLIAFLEVDNIHMKNKIYLSCENKKLDYNRIKIDRTNYNSVPFDLINLFILDSKIKYIIVATQNDEIIHIEKVP